MADPHFEKKLQEFLALVDATIAAADALRGEDLAFDHEDMLVDAARLLAG